MTIHQQVRERAIPHMTGEYEVIRNQADIDEGLMNLRIGGIFAVIGFRARVHTNRRGYVSAIAIAEPTTAVVISRRFMRTNNL